MLSHFFFKLILFLIIAVSFCTPTALMADYCIFCGQSLPDQGKFCSKCGKEQVSAKSQIVKPQENSQQVPPGMVLVRIGFLADQNNKSILSQMYHLTTNPEVLIGEKTFASELLQCDDMQIYQLFLPQNLMGKEFKVVFNADRRKHRGEKFDQWSNKKIEMKNTLELTPDNMCSYIVLMTEKWLWFVGTINFDFYSLRQLNEAISRESLEAREAERIGQATANYLQKKDEADKKYQENLNRNKEQRLKEDQLEATQENNRRLSELNLKIGN